MENKFIRSDKAAEELAVSKPCAYMEIVDSEWCCDKQVERTKKINHQSTIDDIPKIFWKYFDLYRRRKITLYQYSESTGLSIPDIMKFLRETIGKSAKIIEKTK